MNVVNEVMKATTEWVTEMHAVSNVLDDNDPDVQHIHDIYLNQLCNLFEETLDEG